MIYYFPSCNYTKASPEHSELIKRYLAKQGVQVLGCCRGFHKKLTDIDTAITICQSCYAIVDENTNAKQISVFEYLDEIEDFKWPDYQGQTMIIQDCLKAKDKPELHKAVRSILKKMNINIIELPNNKEKCDYCGVFPYNEPIKANLMIAPIYFGEIMKPYYDFKDRDTQQLLMEQRKELYQDYKVVCYCNSCLRGVKMVHNNATHLMDLIFPIEE